MIQTTRNQLEMDVSSNRTRLFDSAKVSDLPKYIVERLAEFDANFRDSTTLNDERTTHDVVNPMSHYLNPRVRKLWRLHQMFASDREDNHSSGIGFEIAE